MVDDLVPSLSGRVIKVDHVARHSRIHAVLGGSSTRVDGAQRAALAAERILVVTLGTP